MLRQEILSNRQKVISFLKQPDRKKAKKMLDKGLGKRCCLGHMCYALKIKRKKYYTYQLMYVYGKENNSAYAPPELVLRVGLYTNQGDSKQRAVLGNTKFNSLLDWNDCSDSTPQEIGNYLESVIEGGPHTPWKSLNDYPTS